MRNTPLAVAISNEYMYMINKLLSMNVDINAADENGKNN